MVMNFEKYILGDFVGLSLTVYNPVGNAIDKSGSPLINFAECPHVPLCRPLYQSFFNLLHTITLCVHSL